MSGEKRRRIDLPDRNTNEIDQEMFTDLVKNYPCLWNTRLSSNKDYEKRKNAWVLVSESLHDGGAYSGIYIASKQQKFILKFYRFLSL